MDNIGPLNQRDVLQQCHQNTVLSQPCIEGYMSVDVSRNYRSDLSQLKFVTHIPKGRLSWDLNHNIDKAVKRTTDENDEKIDLLLKFLLDQCKRFNFPPKVFITYRRTLINVMYSTYHLSEPLCIRASLYKNKIYLYDLESEQESQRKQSRTEHEKRFSAWGYKFEQYMTSDHPTLAPNIDVPVVENEEFSLYYSSKIGDHHLFYGAQIDALLVTNSTCPIPITTNQTEIISYLRRNQYIELKTNRLIQSPNQEKTFKKYKLFRSWCQCYLANLKGLLVGYRDDNGIVQQLRWFETGEIAEFCKHEWDPKATLNFLNYFLNFVHQSFNSHNQGNNAIDPITLDFQIDFNRKINVVAQKDSTFLPNWYLEALNK